jgi:S1-C subfamily serine protease
VIFYLVTISPQLLLAQLSETILIDRKSAVVLVRADQSGGVREIGAGIIVGYDNSSIYIITATHVVEQKDERATKVYVEFYNKPTSIREAIVLKTDADRDLALLYANGADLINSVRPLPIADLSKPLIETSVVYTVGHPGKRIWSMNTGPRAVVNNPDPTKVGFSVDAIEPGNSGGPLFNANAELLGMVLGESSYGGYALRADLVKAFLSKIWNSPTNN